MERAERRRARAELELRKRQRAREESFAEYRRRVGMDDQLVTRTVGDLVERSTHERLRAVVSTPPRHGKTDTVLRGIAWMLRRDPSRTHAFTTYAAELANSKSRIARRYARENRVPLSREATGVKEWRTRSGGGLLATGVRGPLTGQGITGLGVVDDPIKNREEAESQLVRDRIWEWFDSVFVPRLEAGASAIVIATRWHPDDLSGRLIGEGWEYVNLPLLDTERNPSTLWPQRYDEAWAERMRDDVTEATWHALYQGEPRYRGNQVYKGVSWYDPDAAPWLRGSGYKEGVGFDAAYTRATHADWTVALQGRQVGDSTYLTGMVREQLEPREYIPLIKAAGITKLAWYLSSTERGLAELFRDNGIAVRELRASTDKYVRAQPSAQAWNDGRILLPRGASWAEALYREVLSFTGVNDASDDVVDALAALHKDLARPDRVDLEGLRAALGST